MTIPASYRNTILGSFLTLTLLVGSALAVGISDLDDSVVKHEYEIKALDKADTRISTAIDRLVEVTADLEITVAKLGVTVDGMK